MYSNDAASLLFPGELVSLAKRKLGFALDRLSGEKQVKILGRDVVFSIWVSEQEQPKSGEAYGPEEIGKYVDDLMGDDRGVYWDGREHMSVSFDG